MNNKYNPVIPARFFKEVALHVISNNLCNSSEYVFQSQPPLLLGIHGKSGQGKSFQIEEVLKKLKIKAFHISGSQLESESAGEPAKLILENYLKASKFNLESINGTAIVIDDVDAGFGQWGELVQYTVNTQIINATLMHLADNPYSIEVKDSFTMKMKEENVKRVPVILTGNDFTKLYEPISRPGRMRPFYWEPCLEEKIEMLTPIFPYLNEDELKKLIQTYINKKVSFFINLKSFLVQEKIWEQVQKIGEETYLDNLKANRIPRIENTILLNDLLKAAKSVCFHSSYKNNLQKKGNGKN